MESRVEKIDATKAAFYLSKNTINRPLRPSVVKFYADILRRGKWKLSHQGIAFDTNGNLVDGQHRLSAIASSDVAVDIMVTHNCDSDVFDCLDIGVKRTMSDALNIGKPHSETYSAIARLMAGQTRVSADMVEDVMQHMSEYVEELLSYAPTKNAYFSSAPSKMCAALRMAQGKDADYIKELYRMLVLSKLEDMPPIGLAINKQLLSGKASSKNNYDNIARMWNVFDASKRQTAKVVVSDPVECILEIRKFYIDKFGRYDWVKM